MHPQCMPKGEHTALVEKRSEYDSKLGKNVQCWLARCECGWEQIASSRTLVRDMHRCHKEGKAFAAPAKKERVSVTEPNKARVLEILSGKGPLRSEELRREFFRLGETISEPTVRKLLYVMVEKKQIGSREFASKRSKRTVLYFTLGTSVETLEAKVRLFDRIPSGFSIGQSF